jgi:hypothetical protein
MSNDADDIARTEKRELAILLRMQEKGGKITFSDLRNQLLNTTTKNADGQMVPNVMYSRQTPGNVMARLVQEGIVGISKIAGGSGGSYSLLPASESELFRLQAKYPDIETEQQAEPKSTKTPKSKKDVQSVQLTQARKADDDGAFRAALGPYAQKLFDEERAKQREQEENSEDRGRQT